MRRRAWQSLNGEWEFGFDQPDFDRRIMVPFAYQSRLSGIGERTPHDTVWYRRRFTAPQAERLTLHFGAVDYSATVWINGVSVAKHEGGHTPFQADISTAVRPGVNELVVRADDPAGDRTLPRGKQYWLEKPQGIFYTPTTGIWQSVWLEPLPNRHIVDLRLWPRLDESALDFEVSSSERGLTVEVEASIGDQPAGRCQGASGRGRLMLSRVVAWTPEAPHLYDLTVTLTDDNGVAIDRVQSYFGLRTVATGNGRFLLNGQPYVQRLILDQGYFPEGWYTAADDADLRRDIELAKSLGFNGARKHQKIEDPRWLYWADRLGFLVWAEMPAFHQYSPQAESRLRRELAAFVQRDRDRPSVVAWVPANESFGLDALGLDERAAVLLQRYRLVRRLDDSRLIVSNDGWEHAITDLCTLHDYGTAAELRSRYRTSASTLDSTGRARRTYLPGFAYHGEPMLVSEFGGVAIAEASGGYSAVPGPDELARELAEMVGALMSEGPVEGFCYTQLTDVEQERNGLLTFDRRPKADLSTLNDAIITGKRR